MKKIPLFLRFCLLASLLFACEIFAIPIPLTEPSLATATALPPTQTPFPPVAASDLLATATSLPPTETAVPGQPVVISQIQMLDEIQGWAWASKADSSIQLIRTQDGGKTWKDVSPRDLELNPSTSFFLDAQTAWIAQYDPAANTNLLLRTTDGGENWVSLPQNDFQEIQNAIFTFTTPNDGLAEAAGVGAGNLYLNLYTTADGGATWAPILLTAPTPEPDLPAGTVHLCNICGDSLYYDPERAVITYGDLASPPTGVVRLSISTDLGQNWKDVTLPFPDSKFANGMAAPKTPAFWGSEGVLPVNLFQYAADNSLVYSELVIYLTHDGGQSWAPAPASVDNGAAQVNTVKILSPTTIFTRCGRDLCVTRDGAQTWQQLASELNFDPSASSADYVSQFEFVTPSTGWAISGEAPSLILWKTTEGGSTWIKLDPTLMK